MFGALSCFVAPDQPHDLADHFQNRRHRNPIVASDQLEVIAGRLRSRDQQHRKHLELLVAERTADLTATVERLSRAEEALRASESRFRRLADADLIGAEAQIELTAIDVALPLAALYDRLNLAE